MARVRARKESERTKTRNRFLRDILKGRRSGGATETRVSQSLSPWATDTLVPQWGNGTQPLNQPLGALLLPSTGSLSSGNTLSRSSASSTLRDYFKKLQAKRRVILSFSFARIPSLVDYRSSHVPLSWCVETRSRARPSNHLPLQSLEWKGRNSSTSLSLPTISLVGVGRFTRYLVYLLKRAEQRSPGFGYI